MGGTGLSSKGIPNGMRIRRESPFSLEAIRLMKRLWTEPGSVDFHGKYVNAKGAALEPKPIQKPYPPIWWGGHLPVSLHVGGKVCGWMDADRPEMVRR